MLIWQRRARWLVLAVAVAVVAVVFATTRRRDDLPPPEPVARIDPAAIVESSGSDIVQVKGERGLTHHPYRHARWNVLVQGRRRAGEPRQRAPRV